MPRAAVLLALAAVLLAAEWAHASYIDPGDEDVEINLPDYGEDPADLQMLQDVGKSVHVIAIKIRSSLVTVYRITGATIKR
ncbi:hypothetical protein evm_003144 [Chilo suppressalis]|nr:hypothetical protein evm_003144 [Chilo suppressalis]